MAVLSEGKRRALEKAVLAAREVAEAGARAAIQQLAVHAAEPSSHLSPSERDLRNRLRARARQLGDTRDAKSGAHGIEHLVVECAYEHWHRMLFARFLAENNVLMHPDGVPVSLEECEELAPSEGAADGWELAARYAERMLPQIFRPGSPVFELKLPPEKGRELERFLDDLPSDVFTASDSLGWVYQFWQAKKKEEVNESEVKIGAEELPAVTQLFTEPYMVQFLLHNTLGAWWVGRHGRDSLPLEMPYLRFLDDGTPAAGTFDGWPKRAAELKVLDPCCGSGHFLVAAFEILVRFRMAEESLSPADACAAVLRDNLHGLEIDERCTQIAAFALALAAWTFPEAGGSRALPPMHIACSGLAPRAKKSDWLALAGDDERLRNGMEWLYELFQDAPVLGSLIDPTIVGVSGKQQELGTAQFNQLKPLLDNAVERDVMNDAGRRELGIVARGIVAAAALLARSYDLIATNVPYLTRGRQSAGLTAFCDLYYDSAKNDLATVFVRRILKLSSHSGTMSAVVPQNWLFLASYEALRRELIASHQWDLLARLGPGAFGTISGEVVNASLLTMSMQAAAKSHCFAGLDANQTRTPAGKAIHLLEGPVILTRQAAQLDNPDARLVFGEVDHSTAKLEEYASSFLGLGTGDFQRFGGLFWELPKVGSCWARLQTAAMTNNPFGGRQSLVYWDHETGRVRGMSDSHRKQIHNQDQSGRQAWGKSGAAVALMKGLRVAWYSGDVFDKSMAAVVPNDPGNLPAIMSFCRSAEFRKEVRRIDQKVIVANGTLVKVPFNLERWQKVAEQEYSAGLVEPHTNDPTQWIFRGTVSPSAEPLHVAVARLLGYRWPEQVNDALDDLIDDDGIVCLPAVRGEQPAATRLQRLLSRALGDEWSPHKQAELLNAVGCKGWSLERWLSERFFKQHCDVFQNRPFIWHVWDGLKKGGFGALVNYHRLDRKLLETLTYNYVGDWIRRQEDGVKRGEDGADDRLQAVRGLQDKLKRILEGEPPSDIFVRWKPIEQQPMGWDPDINDGVRINIRPFMLAGDVGKKGAGILRDKPNIKWGKDRGKDPSDAPWYDEFGGDRINDNHLTLAQKQVARVAAGGG